MSKVRIKGKPRLIVFEGPDDSGKTTLSHALVKYLNSNGIACDYFAFPGGDVGTLGKLVHTLHHDSRSMGVESLTPTSLQLLHIAAHVDAIESRIRPSLRIGRTIVLDRFWWSTWVYGRVSGIKDSALRAMIRSEVLAWGKIRPAMIFLLTRFVQDRTKDYKQLAEQYQILAEREAIENRVRSIANDNTVEDTLAKIISNLEVQETKYSNGPIRVLQNEKPHVPPSHEPASGNTLLHFTRRPPPKPTIVFDTYWRFAAERQSVFFRRLVGKPAPWTTDTVLEEYKFTNAYRASDRTSQYLIKRVIYHGEQSPKELFFRILLFKFFNKISTWEMLENEIGNISFADFSFHRYERVLNRAIESGKRIYSAAYIMPAGSASAGTVRKHQMHLKLLEQMMHDDLPARLVEARSMKRAFELIRSYPSIGDFLAYQFVTDLNYSTLLNFSEMDFVVPGPGARDGIRKCFKELGGLSEIEIIQEVADTQQTEFQRLGLKFQTLWGRPLQLIDCQNLFCEVDKYARIQHPEFTGITGRVRIKQRFRSNPEPISVWYPPKWGLNEVIVRKAKDVSSI
jgi:thymidylate kinase